MRVVFDLKFWRRFITAKPHMGFTYLLGKLPLNKIKLASDASTSYGMAGVLLFENKDEDTDERANLFWQIK